MFEQFKETLNLVAVNRKLKREKEESLVVIANMQRINTRLNEELKRQSNRQFALQAKLNDLNGVAALLPLLPMDTVKQLLPKQNEVTRHAQVELPAFPRNPQDDSQGGAMAGAAP